MTLDADLRPRGPFSLALTARASSDATRLFRDGFLDALVPVSGGHERVLARQLPDGAVRVRAASEEGVEAVRFALALDDDHGAFLRRFADDELLGEPIRRFRGLRQARVSTVAHALLRALCGQLIETRRARALEARIVRSVSGTPFGRLAPPPTCSSLGRLGAADLRALGLHARRAATLVRVCRSLELERLHALPTDAAAARIERERGLGPWSVGVVCMEGLGRSERGLVGDLGLIKLCSALSGRHADAEDTRRLLARYEEWAGLASVYLLLGFSRGLVTGPRERPARGPLHAAA